LAASGDAARVAHLGWQRNMAGSVVRQQGSAVLYSIAACLLGTQGVAALLASLLCGCSTRQCMHAAVTLYDIFLMTALWYIFCWCHWIEFGDRHW
jgi:hypothetical protein